MDAEERLLLTAARLEADPAAIALACSPGLDWPRALELAARHGLAPLLHRHLGALDARHVPGPVRANLWALHEMRRRHNDARARELVQIVTALARDEIDCVPYKGPTLALLAYGDLALREFGDLDLLVRREDVPRAQRHLESLGYSCQFDLVPPAQEAALRAASQYHVALQGPLGMVELHWRTDPDFPVEEGGSPWASRLEARPLRDAPIPCFPVSELMLILCMHGSKHHWASLGWLIDIAELARREPIDWPWIERRARELSGMRRLQLGMHLARELLQAPIPDPGAAPAIRDLARRLREEAFAREREPSKGALLSRNLALFDTRTQRLRHAAQVVFSPTPADWTRWRLPRGFLFLYGPLRLARLVARYAGALFSPPSPRSRIGATLRTPPPRPHSRG